MQLSDRKPVRPAATERLLSYTRDEDAVECVVLQDVMMPARDGVLLATDIYLPGHGGQPDDGPFPAILDRTPYDKSLRALTVNDPEYFVRRGYAYVFQDTRGHGKSAGDFALWGVGHDGRDGYDAVEWISEQPWCNGQVATSGWSADCVTQLSLAVEAPPHLAAMFIAHGPSDFYSDLGSPSGALRWCHGVAYSFRNAFLDRAVREDPVLAARIETEYANIEDWYLRQPGRLKKVFDGVPSVERWFSAWLDNRDFNEYWKQPGYNFERYHSQFPDVPMFFMASWFDFFQRGTLRNYIGLAEAHTSPKYLLVTPSVHGPGPSRSPWQGEVSFGAHSPADWDALRLAFFDQHLLGMDTGHFDEPWAKLFVMGGGDGRAVDVQDSSLSLETYGRWGTEPASVARAKMNHGGGWLEAPAWPLTDAVATPFYLHPNGMLAADQPGEASSFSSYEFDPDDPCPQIGGDWTHRPQFIKQPGESAPMTSAFAGPGPRDQVARRGWLGCSDDLPLWARPDVLSFSTAPLTAPIEVVGDIRVVLYVSSSAVDTDFTAKLIDEYPPNPDYPRGFAMLLRDGIVRARYRDSIEHAELMTPGEIYRVEIDLWSTANRFEAGHRIRLDVSSSCFPSYDVNPNTGEPIGFHTHSVVAINSVYHDVQHPSAISLPIRPASDRR
jgi:predicted acyl esterase